MLHADHKSGNAAQASNRVTALEAALESERAARTAAARALDEARGLIQSLQTRLAHAQISFDEALAAERRARTAAEEQVHHLTAAAQTKATEDADAELREEARVEPRAPTRRGRRPTVRLEAAVALEPDVAAAEAAMPQPDSGSVAGPHVVDDLEAVAIDEPAVTDAAVQAPAQRSRAPAVPRPALPPRQAKIKTPKTKATGVKDEREPQPVKWWLPSYRAKRNAR